MYWSVSPSVIWVYFIFSDKPVCPSFHLSRDDCLRVFDDIGKDSDEFKEQCFYNPSVGLGEADSPEGVSSCRETCSKRNIYTYRAMCDDFCITSECSDYASTLFSMVPNHVVMHKLPIGMTNLLSFGYLLPPYVCMIYILTWVKLEFRWLINMRFVLSPLA